MYNEIFSKIRREDVIKTTQKIIQIPAEYDDNNPTKFDYAPISEWMIEEFEKMGMETQIQGKLGFPNPIGRLRGKSGDPSILVTGHYNTVLVGDKSAWKYDPFGGEIVDDRIYGRGAADMKGSIAASMVAMKALAESGIEMKGDIVAMYHAGEGAFEQSIDWLVDNHPEAIQATWCLGAETQLPVAGVGLLWTEIITRGESIHTPAVKPVPSIRNALSDLIKLLNHMEITEEWMKWEPEPLFGLDAKPVCSVTMLEAGDKVNMIPDRARAEVDIRIMPSQSKETVLDELNEFIKRKKNEIPTLDIEKINVYHYSPPFRATEEYEYLLNTIQDVVEEILGYRPERSTAGGGVLPALTRLMPVSGCNFGPKLPSGGRGGGNAHGIDEWVSIDNLVGKTKFMAALFYNLLK